MAEAFRMPKLFMQGIFALDYRVRDKYACCLISVIEKCLYVVFVYNVDQLFKSFSVPEETSGEAVETGVEESIPVEESQPEDEVPAVSVVGWLRWLSTTG